MKNAVEFQYFFRPNRLMTKVEQEFGEDYLKNYKWIIRSRKKIEENMKNSDRSKLLINDES